MSILKFNDEILVLSDSLKVEEVINKVITITSKQLVRFFKKENLSLPVRLKREAFLKVLYEPALLKLKDEKINYEEKILLEHLPALTIYQLTKLLKSFDSDLLNVNYLKELWLNVLYYLLTDEAKEETLLKFIYLKEASKPQKEEIALYNFNLKEVFVDGKNCLEGLSFDDLRLVLYKTINKEDMINLAKLHQVNIKEKLTIKEATEELLKNALHTKAYYRPLKDESIYEKELDKLALEEEKTLTAEEELIAIINNLKDEVKALKEEVKEIQKLEIILIDEDE